MIHRLIQMTIIFHEYWWNFKCGCWNKWIVCSYLEIQAIGRGKSGGFGRNKYSYYYLYNTNNSHTPSTIPGGNISGLNLIIKPEYNDSVIELKFNIFCGVGNDVLFRITKTLIVQMF